MRKTLSDKEAADRLENTLEAINSNADKGKLKPGHKVPLFRLPDGCDPSKGLNNDALSTLLVEWLKIQGVSLVFDDQIARRTLDKAVTRLETLIPPG